MNRPKPFHITRPRVLIRVLLGTALLFVPRADTFAQAPKNAGAAQAVGQSPGDAGRGRGRGFGMGGHGPGKDFLRDEVLDQMRAMRMWRITNELKLDESTAAKLFPLLAHADEQERDLGKERGEIIRALRDQMAAAAPDSSAVNGLIDRMVANRARRMTQEQEKFSAIRKVLNPIAQARLMMLLRRIEDEFHQRIREAADRSRPAGGPGRRDPDRLAPTP